MSSSFVDTTAHAAAVAWRSVEGSGRAAAIRTMKERGGSAVYRLVRAARDNSDVIAKRCARVEAHRERVIYQQVLAAAPMRSPRFYGHADAGEYGWLFLEDAGGDAFDPAAPVHRALAGRWLGELHRISVRRDVVRCLPPRDSSHYRGVVARAREVLRAARENPAVGPEDAGLLDTLIAHGTRLLSSWEAHAAALRALPQTVVHNDFWSGNLRVRREFGAATLLPFDWGAAGWGSPAADLANVDLGAYLEVGGPAQRCSAKQLAGAMATGKALHVLGAIPGEAARLGSAWPGRSLRKLHAYAAELDEIGSAGRD